MSYEAPRFDRLVSDSIFLNSIENVGLLTGAGPADFLGTGVGSLSRVKTSRVSIEVIDLDLLSPLRGIRLTFGLSSSLRFFLLCMGG